MEWAGSQNGNRFRAVREHMVEERDLLAFSL
jgi:hypothetical protein